MTEAKHLQVVGASEKPARNVRRPGGNIPRPFGTYKAAVEAVVIDCGGQEKAAQILGCSVARVNAWTRADQQDEIQPFRLEQLVRASGSAAMAHHFAALAGTVRVVPMETGAGDLRELAASANEEAAEFCAAFIRKAADGLTVEEQRQLLKEAREAQTAWARVEAALQAGLTPGAA